MRVVALAIATLLGADYSKASHPQSSLSSPAASVPIVDHDHRQLEADFAYLGCNAALNSQPLQLWSSVVGSLDTYSEVVEIGCGTAVALDVDVETLRLEGGLAIIGKLVIPNGKKIHIETPFIRVEGEFHVTSLKPIDGNVDVKITLTGYDENVKFMPADTNADACGGGFCAAGKKSFVVAGGKLVINGMEEDTSTWLNLHDVVSIAGAQGDIEYPKYVAPSAACPPSGILINESFETPFGSNSAGSLGSHFSFENGVLKVNRRTSYRHGPEFDLKDLRGCLEVEQTYLLTMKVRLSKEGAADGTPVDCAESGTGCLRIDYEYMKSNESRSVRVLHTDYQSLQRSYGEWFTIAKQVTFSEVNLDDTNIYQVIRLEGPSEGIDIEVDDVVFRMPPQEAFPDETDVCRDLIPGNGDAEAAGLNFFPFLKSSNYLDVVVAADETTPDNHYFQVSARNYGQYTQYSNSDTSGMRWDVSPGCLQKGAVYHFQAKVRVHPNSDYPDPVVPKIWFRVYHDDGGATYWTYHRVTTCPTSDGSGFVSCDGLLTISEEMLVDAPYRVSMYLETVNALNVDYDMDDISFVRVQTPLNGVVVANTVQDKWVPGAEILITSHTLNYDDGQVRRITGVSEYAADGDYVTLSLDSAIIRPTTVLDNPNFAVEVALLSRNIKIEGAGDDPNPLHGAHLVVMRTPTIEQKLQGVEFNNFGQQGTLGRYPIHFHLCGDVPGSRVSKNIVRESNQRCVVVHGTNHLQVDSNIAFDTKGHCFMTEDGMETDNFFTNNLGALTDRVTVVIPDNGKNGKESDMSPATFWMTNPHNTLEGNVAAGSKDSGFWFELRSFVRGSRGNLYPDMNPRTLSLKSFRNNVAHSNGSRGLRTYPNGYVPDEQAVFYNLRAYRNSVDGVFFHNSRNLGVSGGVFADNRDGIDFDRAEYLLLENAEIIGVSPEYRALMASQTVPVLCTPERVMAAIVLHTFARTVDDYGAKIKNMTISGFTDTGCGRASAIQFDEEVRRGDFDYFSSVAEVEITDESPPVDMCVTTSVGVSGAYLVDLDSSLKHTESAFTGVSAVVAETHHVLAFLDQSSCVEVPEYCYSYCEDVCLRTVTYSVDVPETDDWKLKICDGSDPAKCVEVDGTFWYQPRDTPEETHMRNTITYRRRRFAVTLPPGSYNAVFLDSTGEESWPVFVEETYEDEMCDTGIQEGSIQLKVPPVEVAFCEDLIRNGDVELSSTDHTYWLHRAGGVRLVPNGGIFGSNALGDYTHNSDTSDAIAQHLDTRCLSLMKGRSYEIKAWVRLANPDTDEVYMCDEGTEKCPEVGIYANRYGDTWSKEPVAVTAVSANPEEFQLVQGVLKITEEIASAQSLVFYVERNKKNLAMFVDNVSMTLMPETTPATCASEIVYNGGFETGDTQFWSTYTEKGLEVVSPGASGNYALKMIEGSMLQFTRNGCMELGERYVARAEYKLVHKDTGAGFACDPFVNTRPTECPVLKLRPAVGDQMATTYAALAIGTPSATEWNSLYGIFTANELYANSESIRLTFGEIATDHNLIIDNVAIAKLPKNCSELVVNGDMELGYTAFWDEAGQGILSDTEGYNSANAVRFSSRQQRYNGAEYEAAKFMDYRCLTPGSAWTVRARIKVFDAGTQTGSTCSLTSTSSSSWCPQFRIRLYDEANPSDIHSDFKLRNYATSAWDADGFNLLEDTFTVPADVTLSKIVIILRDFRVTLDVAIDDFSITPA